MPVCDQILSIVLDWFSCLNLHRLLCACQISLYCSKLLESAKPASSLPRQGEWQCLWTRMSFSAGNSAIFFFLESKKDSAAMKCCSKVHRKQYYYTFVEMTGVFKVNVSPFLSPPHTLCSALSCTLSLSFPVCCECWRCQGASVFSVTTVIVKQWVQKGPLLFYSQKAEGRIYFTVIPSPTSPTLFCLPLPPQDIS